MKRKVISVLLVVVMLMAMFATTASAAVPAGQLSMEKTGSNWTITLNLDSAAAAGANFKVFVIDSGAKDSDDNPLTDSYANIDAVAALAGDGDTGISNVFGSGKDWENACVTGPDMSFSAGDQAKTSVVTGLAGGKTYWVLAQGVGMGAAHAKAFTLNADGTVATPVDVKASPATLTWAQDATDAAASKTAETVKLYNAGTAAMTVTGVTIKAGTGTNYDISYTTTGNDSMTAGGSADTGSISLTLTPKSVATATTGDGDTITLVVAYGTGETAEVSVTAKILAPFSATISNLSQTYDGTPKAATVSNVTDAGEAVTGYTVTYTGTAGTTYTESETAPTNAGSYTVTVKKGDKSVTDTLVIGKKGLTVEAKDSTVAPGTALTEDLFLKAAAATPLGTGDTMASLFSGAVTSGSASTNGVTVTFYEWDEGTPAVPCTCPGGVHDATNTDCHQAAAVPATWKALAANPTEAGTYKFTVGVAAAGTFKTNYNLAALTAGTPTLTDENATFDGTLTIENNAPVVPTNNFTVTYNAGLHGSLAAGSATSEKVKKGEKPVNVPEVVAEKGYTFVGWSADGRTLVKPAEETITRSVTFTALYADHNAYMVGRSTTTFEPNGQMTRAEAAAVLSRLTAGFEEDGEYTAAPYSDLDTSAWYITYVNFAAEKGIIKGYEDGTFRPNAPITRAELATMIAGYMKVAAIDDPAVSSDVAGHWAEGLIAALEKAQVIKGYEDGTFRPNQNITRAEAATMVNGAIDREPQVVDLAGDGYVNPFTDVAESDWFFKEVMEATVAHLIAHFHAA